MRVSGPALSQQIIALERELGVQLFTRDRRSVALTEAGRSLLEDARQPLSLADSAVQRVRHRGAEPSPLRFGYVSWLPDNLDALVAPAVSVRLDDWVLPSHTQADRVRAGSLDLALAWVTAKGAAERGLTAHLVRAEPLPAVCLGASSSTPLPDALGSATVVRTLNVRGLMPSIPISAMIAATVFPLTVSPRSRSSVAIRGDPYVPSESVCTSRILTARSARRCCRGVNTVAVARCR